MQAAAVNARSGMVDKYPEAAVMSRFLVVCWSLLFSWQTFAEGMKEQPKEELIISAASSLTNAFGEIAPLFEVQHPSVKVLLNFGASGALLQQIAKGAPVDVFASADQQTMDQAQTQNLVKADDRHNFASNTLVVVVPANALHFPKVLKDLEQPVYARIAVGVPDSVPVGRYTKKVLEENALWGVIEPKIIRTQNVRQVLDYVARGEVDAGFVYATDAALMPEEVKISFAVQAAPILYPIAPVAASAHHDIAVQFVGFINSAPAHTVLTKYGFGKP